MCFQKDQSKMLIIYIWFLLLTIFAGYALGYKGESGEPGVISAVALAPLTLGYWIGAFLGSVARVYFEE